MIKKIEPIFFLLVLLLSFSCRTQSSTPTPTPVEQTISIPAITLNGDNPQQGWLGNYYEEQGGYAVTPETGASVDLIPDSSNVSINEIGNYIVNYSATNSAGTATDTRTYRNGVESSKLEEILKLETKIEKSGGGYMNVMEAIQYLYEQGKIGEMPARGKSPKNMEGSYTVVYNGVSSSGSVFSGSTDIVLSDQDSLSIHHSQDGWLDTFGSIVGGGNKTSIFLPVDYDINSNIDWVDIKYGDNDSSEKKMVRLFMNSGDHPTSDSYAIYNQVWT